MASGHIISKMILSTIVAFDTIVTFYSLGRPSDVNVRDVA
jgi:hypothetical protein